MKNFKIVKEAIWEEKKVFGVTKNGTYFVLNFKTTPNIDSIKQDLILEYNEKWYGTDHRWHTTTSEEVLTASNKAELNQIRKSTKKFFATEEDMTSHYLQYVDEYNRQQKIDLINTLC